jgi:hypothetical protein
MPDRRVIAFDVNETLLDLDTISRRFTGSSTRRARARRGRS